MSDDNNIENLLDEKIDKQINKPGSDEEILDNPLVVHKIGDASYKEITDDSEMTATHTETAMDTPTIERHRYKKGKKSNVRPIIITAIIVIAVAVAAGLYFGGIIGNYDKSDAEKTTKKSYTTQPANQFAGVITVKGTYVFFEGEEIDGANGLDQKVKYLDSGTSFTIQDENADSNYLNYEILPILTQYGINYEITHIVSSGLMSKFETTAPVDTAPSDTSVPDTAPVTPQ